MAQVENKCPLYCAVLPDGSTIYGLYRFASYTVRARQTGDIDLAHDADLVYNFKSNGSNWKRIESEVRAAAMYLGCCEIVAAPGHTPTFSRLQTMFGVSLRRVKEVPTRKYNHKDAINPAEADTLQCESVPSGRVLLVDDVCTTGESLCFFRNYLTSKGAEVVMFAIGINHKMKPAVMGQIDVARPIGDNELKTNADKQAEFVARRNELGSIPPVENPERKESCRLDLEAFGWNYCRDLLRHRASPDIRDGLIRDAQECILNGGQTAELYARGGGKTTWIVYIAAIWAILYGHRRFVVIIGASIAAAKKSLKTIKRILARSPQFLADFPAVAVGIQALKGVSQRAAAQTYNHVPTDIEWGAEQITLPTLRGDDGELLDPACGGILAATGVGGAIRGANEGGQRPDMLLFDDPQTKKAAASPKLVESILEFIHSDALGLAGHDSTIAAFLTITPQRFGDVATAISSRDQYPEWSVKVQPFIKTLPDKWDQLVELFCAEYALDAAARDFRRTRSTAWYRDNRDLFAGMETIDPLQFDKAREIDINHHLLNLRAKMGKQAFDAEIMMHVADAATELKLDVGRVCDAINGAERGVCPPGTDTVVGFCDVNTRAGAGLSWVLVAFGPRRVGAVIDYWRLPADGTALVPENASETERDNIVASAMREVVQYVASRKIRDSFGRAVRVRAFGFDRGWLPAVVHRTLFVLRHRLPLGFELAAARGYSWQGYNESKSTTIRTGDHMKAAPSKYGQFLGYMAPYWREVMQSGLLGVPLTPGSLSIFGADPAEHRRFAQEICAERLVRKYQIYGGGASKSTTVAWDWNTTGPEHWCDALTGAFVMASWYRAYDALSSTVDAAALGVKVAQEIVAPPLEDMERDMEDAPLAPLPARLAVRRKVKPKFKRGRFIK